MTFARSRFTFYCLALLLSAPVFPVGAADGFATINGNTTGGAGGTTVTVTNGTDFNTQINITGPRIIQVQGPISIGRIFTTANKTIIGLGTNATLLGNINISDVTNVIVQNLRISSPGNDGLTIWNAQHVWVDHCTFYDCGDGCCDMNRGSQYVTVSWCKFHYPTQVEHRFTMIADGYVNGGVTNYGYYTLHHNWWSSRADQRMPASSYGRIHMYNNYFNCTNNSYCSNARNETQFVSENNYYSGVHNPLYADAGSTGLIRATNNIYSGTTGTAPAPGTDIVSMYPLPYAYTLDDTTNVPALIANGAGATGPVTIPIPPKIWDGGGSGNNWNTANNWGLNETPKMDDVIVFAGVTRLTPNNDFTANTEYSGLTFSNTAGAFVLGGNAISLGGPITDDSTAVQTINLNIDFGFGQFHYVTNRVIDVISSSGSLVMNGRIRGDTNAYFNLYSVTKQGDGLVTFNGINTFKATVFLNGGTLKFNTLDTNVAGSLGSGPTITFNGGALQWNTGNSADISVRTVVISTNGATLDTGNNSVTFTNRIGNNGAGGLTKLGAGTLVFNATNNYRGNTMVGQGTLALGAAGLLTNSPQIILSNNATLDVSGRGDATLALASGQTLKGAGMVKGSVTAGAGSTVAPGFSTGVLTISNALLFQAGSTNVMELDKSARTNDLITGLAAVTYGGRLILTNLDGTLAAGDSFKLFSAGSYGGSFTNITWPALTGNLQWTNRLAVDGTIAVLSSVNPLPTNIVLVATNGGLQLSWPTDHIGWHLQAQTNALNVGLGTNWVDVSGSDATNQVFIPLDPAVGSVFLRLVYP